MTQCQQAKFARERWRSVLLCGIFGASSVYVLQPVFETWLSPVVSALAALQPIGLLLAACVMAGLAIYHKGRSLGGGRSRGCDTTGAIPRSG